MDRATTGHNLRPLVRDGFVEISVGENDRRERIVTVTKEGHKMHTRALAAWRRAQTAFELAIGEREAADLRDLMNRVVDVPLPRPE
jgi:DNA-binding MarR family transcriptional regulator